MRFMEPPKTLHSPLARVFLPVRIPAYIPDLTYNNLDAVFTKAKHNGKLYKSISPMQYEDKKKGSNNEVTSKIQTKKKSEQKEKSKAAALLSRCQPCQNQRQTDACVLSEEEHLLCCKLAPW